MGEQTGEATGNLIRGFAVIALERVNKSALVSRDNAMAVAASILDYVEAYRLN
jgi:hypothetical protein